MRAVIVTALSCMLFTCQAEPALAGQSAAVVQSASCVEVSRQHSVAGAIGGSTVGAGRYMRCAHRPKRREWY